MERNEFLRKLREVELVTAISEGEKRKVRICRKGSRFYLETGELQEISGAEFDEMGTIFYEADVLSWKENYGSSVNSGSFSWKLTVLTDERETVSVGEGAAPETFNELLICLTQLFRERMEERFHPLDKA